MENKIINARKHLQTANNYTSSETREHLKELLEEIEELQDFITPCVNAAIDAGEYNLDEFERYKIKNDQRTKPYWTDVTKAVLKAAGILIEK